MSGVAAADGAKILLTGKAKDDDNGARHVTLSVVDTHSLSREEAARVESYSLRAIAYSGTLHRAFLADAAGFRSISLAETRHQLAYKIHPPCDVSALHLVNADRHVVGIDACRVSIFRVDAPIPLSQIELKALATITPCPTHGWGDLVSLDSALYRVHVSTGRLCRVALQTQSISDGLNQYPPRGGRLQAFTESLDRIHLFIGTEIGLLVVLQRHGPGFREVDSRAVCRNATAVRRHSTGHVLVITCREKVVFFDAASLTVVGEIAFFPRFRWIAVGSDRFATNDYEYLEGFGWNPKGDARVIVPFESLSHSRIEKSAADALFKARPATAPARVDISVPHTEIKDVEILPSGNGYVLRANIEVQPAIDGGASDLKVFLNDRLAREYPAVPAGARFAERGLRARRVQTF